jgi:ribonuclease E
VAAPAPEPVQAPAAPVTASVPTAPVPAAKAIDAGTLDEVVAQAGLQWVQTAPSAAVEPEPIVLTPRPPRVRKPRAAPAAEPLVQIETGASRNEP